MRYLSVTSPDINNGLGCRVTLWVAGCHRHCEGCHNPETWGYLQGTDLFDKENGAFEKIIKELDKPYIQGLTISGGDPLDQSNKSLEQLKKLIRTIQEYYPEKDVWIYTGCYFDELNDSAKEVLKLCDVLVDGPFILKQRDITIPFRGSTNQRIIDLKKTFKKGKVVLKEIQ